MDSTVSNSDATSNENCDQTTTEKPPLTKAEIVTLELEQHSPLHPYSDRVWSRHLAGKSIREIARDLKCDKGVVERCINDRSDHLRNIYEPDAQAGARAIVLEHMHESASFGKDIMEDCSLEIKDRVTGANMRLKAAQHIAQMYGLLDVTSDGPIINQDRLQQVQNRIKLVGPHAVITEAQRQKIAGMVGMDDPQLVAKARQAVEDIDSGNEPARSSQGLAFEVV
jgi:hypothetical protein